MMSDREDETLATVKLRDGRRFWNLNASHWLQAVPPLLFGLMQLWILWRQADIMDQQARIAGDQLSASKETQRAFINVSSLEQKASADGARVVLTPLIVNSGTSAARNVTIISVDPNRAALIRSRNSADGNSSRLDWKLGAPPDPAELLDRSDDTDVLFKFPNLSVGPQGTISASQLSSDLPADAGMAASANQIGRYLYGLVRYEDIFDIEHVTKFCFRIDGFQMTQSGPRLLQGICRHWNCTDDDCRKDREAYDSESSKERALSNFGSPENIIPAAPD